MCYQDLVGPYTDPNECFMDYFLTPPPTEEPIYPEPSISSPVTIITPPITSGICAINEFSLNGQDNTIQDPLINVSRAPAKLVFQTNSELDCERCQLTCSPDSCSLNPDLLGGVSKPFNKQYSFRLPKVTSPNYYLYAVEYRGAGGNYVSRSINLKVLPMFNWREINPGSF